MRQVRIPNHLPFILAVRNDAELGGLLICRVLSIIDVMSTIRLRQSYLFYEDRWIVHGLFRLALLIKCFAERLDPNKNLLWPSKHTAVGFEG